MFDWVLNTPLLQVSPLTMTFSWEFLGIFKTSYQQSNCEWLPLSSLIFFLETFSFLFEAISLAVRQKLIFENMTLKSYQFSLNNYLKDRNFRCTNFSNFVKLHHFQINFLFKVRLWKLIPAKEVFETHLRKLDIWNIRHLNLSLWSAFSIWKIKKGRSNEN